jgi:hypothetical protein
VSHEPPIADAELLAGFTSATLPGAAFGHREHIRVAYLFLRTYPDFAGAAGAFRAALRKFVAALGATDRYHETLTWLYLALVLEHMDGHEDADSLAFLARCPELARHRGGALEQRCDVEAMLASPLARRIFVAPRRGTGGP